MILKDDGLYYPEPEYMPIQAISDSKIVWPPKDGPSDPTLGLTCPRCGWVHTRKRWTNRTVLKCQCGGKFKFDYGEGWNWYAQ